MCVKATILMFWFETKIQKEKLKYSLLLFFYLSKLINCDYYISLHIINLFKI